MNNAVFQAAKLVVKMESAKEDGDLGRLLGFRGFWMRIKISKQNTFSL